LLRSVAVRPDARGQGLARRLLETALDMARRHSITRIYLFSKDTGDFFESLGWKEVPVKEAAEVMRAAPQVKRYNQIGWYLDERAFRRDILYSLVKKPV
jgi:N-acetylglutamate synthase-like GNAT family acetyltransferase